VMRLLTAGRKAALPMELQFDGATDCGYLRTNNEDHFFLSRDDDDVAGRGWLFAVADGLGGQPAGEVASRFMVDALVNFYGDDLPGGEMSSGASLERLVRAASRRIYEAGIDNTAQRGMGTTCTIGHFKEALLTIVHVGDSRLYRFRHGTLRQLTEDQTLAEALVKRGEIARAEAANHPGRHILFHSIGGEELDEVFVKEHVVESGDRYLLCTDGLNEMLSDDHIAALLAHHRQPANAVRKLIKKANKAGGTDNITVIVVDVM